VLLTLSGWSSPRVAETSGVRQDTVRLWRSDFSSGGVAAIQASMAPGPPPVKRKTALRVVTPLLEDPVADRKNWTTARLRAEIEAREGVRISRSQLSQALRKKFRWRRPRHTLKGRQAAGEVDRIGLRLQLRRCQAEAGDIVLLSMATKARRWCIPVSPAPGRSLGRTGACRRRDRSGQEGGDAGLAQSCHARTHRPYQPDQTQH
jgi:transposase